MYALTNTLLLLAALVFCAVCYRTGWTAHYANLEDVPPHMVPSYQRLRHFYRFSIALNIGTLLVLAAYVLAHGAFDAGEGLTLWAFWAGVGLAALAGLSLLRTLRR